MALGLLEQKHGENFRGVANVFATPRHKGWEVQVVRVPIDKAVIPQRIEEKKSEAKKEEPKPIEYYPPVYERRDDSFVDKSYCFACKGESKFLESYYPFPGGYCPRDKKRARAGKFVLRKFWEEAEKQRG